MFDAKTYFDRVEEVLSTNLDRFEIKGQGASVWGNVQWTANTLAVWDCEILFCTGHRLAVREIFGRLCEPDPIRSLNYQFMSADDECIFRIDSHGRVISFEQPCHVHVGADEVLEHDDPRIKEFDLVALDFLSVFSLAFNFAINNKPLPWD